MSRRLRTLLLILLIVNIGILIFWAAHFPAAAQQLRDARRIFPNITAEQQRPSWLHLRISQMIAWTLIAACSAGAAVLGRGYSKPQSTSATAQRKRLSAMTAIGAALIILLFGFLLWPFVLQTRVSTSSGFRHIVKVSVLDDEGNRPVANAQVAATFDPSFALPRAEWAIADADGRCTVNAYFAGAIRTTRFSRSGNLSALGWLLVRADGFDTYRRPLRDFFGEKLDWKGSPPSFACTVRLSQSENEP